MILFHAGTTGSASFEATFYSAMKYRNRLISYADLGNLPWVFKFWYERPEGRKLFLDSGAYSVLTRGVTIELDKYIEYIKVHADDLFIYATLDVIGDHGGTRRNFETMRKAGLDPLATFHFSHDGNYDLLEEYCKEGTKILALGGLVPMSTQKKVLRDHLNRCFQILGKYWPIKVHSYGITAQWALERYPFYSADSSSAILGGGMGKILTFDDGRLKTTSWRKHGKVGKHLRCVDGIGREGSAHMARRTNNIATLGVFEDHLTNLWKVRGIEWQ